MSDQELSSEDEEIGPVESDESDVGEVEENDSIQTLSSLEGVVKEISLECVYVPWTCISDVWICPVPNADGC